MNSMLRKLSLLAGLGVCSVVISSGPPGSGQLRSDVRPWCVGRFIFDRPIASEISNESYEFRGNRIETTYDVNLDFYREKATSLKRDLHAGQRINPARLDLKSGRPWLERVIYPTRESTVFLYQKGTAKFAELPFHSEGYIYAGNTLFHTIGMIGSSAPQIADSFYNDFYRRIKSRDNWTVPTESGFCFNGGIVAGSSTYTEEVSQSFALMPGRPALLLIKMRDSVSDDRDYPLTRDLSGLRAQLRSTAGRYRILRQGKRPIAGMDAEEVLFALHDGTVFIYQFYLLAPGNPETLAQPHTEIQLLLGASPRSDLPPDLATSPVDEAGALQLWDTLLNSLRLRPGAV